MTLNFGRWRMLRNGDTVYRRVYIFGIWTPFIVVEDVDEGDTRTWRK